MILCKSVIFVCLIVPFYANAEPSLAPPQSIEPETWSVHFQSTVVSQEHGPIRSPYAGTLSLSTHQEWKTSLTSTLFLGRKLWPNASAYINPEVSAGSGLSDSHGIAGFPNGEIYRVDSPEPQANLSRFYIKQIFALSDETENIEADKNQLAIGVAQKRFTIILGKFSLNDFFDDNTYSHDPRTQFLNWSLMDNGAWDYAADIRGYTWGFYLEYSQPHWAIRFADVMEPSIANEMSLDTNLNQAHGDNLEIEYRYKLKENPGKLRFLAYTNHAHMGNYSDAIAASPTNPDVTQTRSYCNKYGFGLNIEQALSSQIGIFSRVGWNDGTTETWAFTEIDNTFSSGVSLKGSLWGRTDDNIGTAIIINGLSQDHKKYLELGGYGFIIGDGELHYSTEEILEAYYLYHVIKNFDVTADFQFVNNPAYNADRGPVSVASARLHYEF